jgi:hypothetical protein
MTKIINTPGKVAVPSAYAGVNAPIHPINLQGIAASQAGLYEALTGQDADGSGGVSAGITAHIHTDDASRWVTPLVSQAWGSEAWSAGDSVSVALGDGTQLPYSIQSVSGATAAVNEPALYFPITIPTGWAGKPFLVLLRCEGDPLMTVTLATWAGGPPKVPTNVTGSAYLSLKSAAFYPALQGLPDVGQLWWATVTPAAAGVHTLQFQTAIHPALDGADLRRLKSLTVMPEPDYAALAAAPDVTVRPAPPHSETVESVIARTDDPNRTPIIRLILLAIK